MNKVRNGRRRGLRPAHPPETKQRVLAAVAGGRRPSEVADTFGLPKGTVSAWLAKAKASGGLARNGHSTVHLGELSESSSLVRGLMADLRREGKEIVELRREGDSCVVTYRVTETFAL